MKLPKPSEKDSSGTNKSTWYAQTYTKWSLRYMRLLRRLEQSQDLRNRKKDTLFKYLTIPIITTTIIIVLTVGAQFIRGNLPFDMLHTGIQHCSSDMIKRPTYDIGLIPKCGYEESLLSKALSPLESFPLVFFGINRWLFIDQSSRHHQVSCHGRTH